MIYREKLEQPSCRRTDYNRGKNVRIEIEKEGKDKNCKQTRYFEVMQRSYRRIMPIFEPRDVGKLAD